MSKERRKYIIIGKQRNPFDPEERMDGKYQVLMTNVIIGWGEKYSNNVAFCGDVNKIISEGNNWLKNIALEGKERKYLLFEEEVPIEDREKIRGGLEKYIFSKEETINHLI